MCVYLLWVSEVYCPSHAERRAGHKGPAVIMLPPRLGIPHSCTARLRLMLLPSPTDLDTEHAKLLYSGLDVSLQGPSFRSSRTQCPHGVASASSTELNLPTGILAHLQEMEKASPAWARLVRREKSCLPQACCLWQSTKPSAQPRRSPWGMWEQAAGSSRGI